MSVCRDRCSGRAILSGALLLVALVLMSGGLLAQQENPPKAEIFGGYQWLDPGGSIAPPVGRLPSMPKGFGVSGTYNFSEHWGLTIDFGRNFHDIGSEQTLTVGPRFIWRTEGMNMFANTLFGWNRLEAHPFDTKNGLGAVLGGGIDLPIKRFISLRLIEADWVWGHFNYADVVSPVDSALRRPGLSGARLRTGLVFNFGGAPSAPVAASCSVKPSEVMVGEPVTATVTASNFNPKHTLTYNWSTTGGKVSGKDTTAAIDTTGLAGGSYTVTARVSDPKMKKGGEATCNANFTVKEPPKNPPTMSCSANPTTVQAGTPATITCDCKSPDNVEVNVSNWTASGGSISGTGNTATLNTSGASPGPITINATCSDSRGLSTSGSSTVTVEAPPPPPPQASKLSSCDFPNATKPWRVDNTCKAVLDDVAQRLQHEPDSKLVIVGNADPSEKRKNLAAERAVNSKAYLSGGEAKQGIDASRIEVRTGSGGTKTADYWVVPAGATFTQEGTQPVDETQVKPIPDHPRPPAGKKKGAKPKAQ